MSAAGPAPAGGSAAAKPQAWGDPASAPPAPAYGASEPPGAVSSADTLVRRLVARVKAILLTPKTEWPIIAGEATTPSDIYLRYVAPLVAIGVIASFIGATVVGIPVPLLGTVRVGVGAGLASAILQLVLTFVSVFVIALIVDALAPTFGGQKDALRALKVTAYCFTPAWVAAILTIFPALGVVAGLIGLYGLYLLYLGLPVLMRAPPDKSLGYTVVVVLCAIVLSIVISVASALMIGVFGAAGAGAPGRTAAAETTGAAEVLSKALGGRTDADRAHMNRVVDALNTVDLGKLTKLATR